MSSFAPSTRSSALIRAGALIAVIAIIDWRVENNVSLGFLYLFPMLILGAWLERWQLAVAASLCTVLVEVFDPFKFTASEGVPRVILVFAAFFGAGLFVYELAKNRRLEHQHVEDVETEIELRRDAEEQLRILVDSSPAAIFTLDATRKILLANEAAHQLLGVEPGSLAGTPIADYLPALAGVPLTTQRAKMFRTEMECRGRRSSGESFLASVWFSTYRTRSGPRLAAVVIDVSEALRDREESSLEQFMAGSRILVSTVCHEIRNLCGAISAVHANLQRTASATDDYRALGTLIAGLEHIAALELHQGGAPNLSGIDLISLLDELRIIIEPSLTVDGVAVDWRIPEALPLAWADRHTLMQVFLNLVKNSARAMESSALKHITISALHNDRGVRITFEDTGPGVQAPAGLFEPFQSGSESTGIGLYVSRALMRAVKGDLTYEPRRSGCCFAITLSAIEPPAVENRIVDDSETAPAFAGRSHPVS
jgi:two-component system, LuxR family, sensor kinase FixL